MMQDWVKYALTYTANNLSHWNYNDSDEVEIAEEDYDEEENIYDRDDEEFGATLKQVSANKEIKLNKKLYINVRDFGESNSKLKYYLISVESKPLVTAFKINSFSNHAELKDAIKSLDINYLKVGRVIIDYHKFFTCPHCFDNEPQFYWDYHTMESLENIGVYYSCGDERYSVIVMSIYRCPTCDSRVMRRNMIEESPEQAIKRGSRNYAEKVNRFLPYADYMIVCPHCRSSFLPQEWDEFNKNHFGFSDEEVISTAEDHFQDGFDEMFYSCPSCERQVYGTKLVKTKNTSWMQYLKKEKNVRHKK